MGYDLWMNATWIRRWWDRLGRHTMRTGVAMFILALLLSAMRAMDVIVLAAFVLAPIVAAIEGRIRLARMIRDHTGE